MKEQRKKLISKNNLIEDVHLSEHGQPILINMACLEIPVTKLAIFLCSNVLFGQ